MTTETDRAEATRPKGIGRIDPALRDAAAALDIAEFRTESLPAERARADRLAADRAAAVDAAGVQVENRAIAGPGGGQLGLRLYRGPATSAAPLVIYAHGGGFVTGNLDTDHAHCVELARDAGCLVVSVDYRLAPEHPCPAALDDVEAAFRYAVDNSRRPQRRRQPGRGDGPRCGRGAGRRPGPAHVRPGGADDPGAGAAPADARLRCDAIAAGIPAHAGPQRPRGQPGMGATISVTAPRRRTTFRRIGRTWRACHRRSSVAPRSTHAATKPSTTPTDCSTPTCTPNYTSSRPRSTASTRRCRTGSSPRRAPRCTRRRCEGRSPSS